MRFSLLFSSISVLLLLTGCSGLYEAKYVKPSNQYSSYTWKVSKIPAQQKEKIITKEKLVYINNTESEEERLKKEFDSIESEYNFKNTNILHRDSFALIIGINKYKQNTPVKYADTSAMAFEELAVKTLGIPQENIITLLNDNATSGQVKAKIELIKELSNKNGNLYVYFAGHGVPVKDGSTYLLPSDMSADLIHLEPNLKLDNIYAKLSKANAKNVFVFIDSCFSGKDDTGSLLYKGVAPVLRTNQAVISGDKLTILTAGQSTDFANDFPSKHQRLFSYYLIQELSQGKTDLSEIYPEIKSSVKRASLMKGLGYKQVPQIYGNTDQKLY